jgi:hypothetical protein
MKIVELINNIQMPVTNEEADVLSKFDNGQVVLKSDLELREQHLAAQLVNKGALIRKNNNGQIEFSRQINR